MRTTATPSSSTSNRPFYALDTRWAAGTTLSDSTYIDDRYELGKKVGEFKAHDQYYEASGGWSNGLVNGWVSRWTVGATWQESQFEPEPASRSAVRCRPTGSSSIRGSVSSGCRTRSSSA